MCVLSSRGIKKHLLQEITWDPQHQNEEGLGEHSLTTQHFPRPCAFLLGLIGVEIIFVGLLVIHCIQCRDMAKSSCKKVGRLVRIWATGRDILMLTSTSTGDTRYSCGYRLSRLPMSLPYGPEGHGSYLPFVMPGRLCAIR